MNTFTTTVVAGDPLTVPRICLFGCHTEAFREMAQTTLYENKAEYAERWGHDLKVLVGVPPDFNDERSHCNGITWARISEALKSARSGDYDWIYVVGGDTLITNLTIPLTTFLDDDFHFIIANDCCEWNADSFFFRCTTAGIGFMEAVLGEYERLKHHSWVEQQAMIELRDRQPWRGIWKVLPQRYINSYNYRLYGADEHCQPAKREGKDCAGHDGQWQPGDFLIHWPGLSSEVRREQIEKVLPQIVR